MVENLPSAQPENQVHLCDSCRHVFPECPSEKDDVIFGNGKGNDNICACNKYEPPAQSEQRWIPVTERLPESSSVWRTEYLATVFCAQWKEKTETMCVQWENTTVRGKATSRWILNDRLLPKEWKVIAWMPLPKPYEEEKK